MSNDLQLLLGYKLSSSLFLHSKTVSTTGCIPPVSWWVSVVQVYLFVYVFSFKLRTLKFGSFFFLGMQTSLWKCCIASCFFQAQNFESFGVLEFCVFIFGWVFFPLLKLVLHAWALWTLELLCTEKAWSSVDCGSSSFSRLQTLGSR